MRDLANDRYTLFCDDFFKIDGMIGEILKIGYQNGATKTLKEWDKGTKTHIDVTRNIYCPKMIATNKPLEPAIADRMLRLPTQRSSRIMPQITKSDTVWEKGRLDLAHTVLTHWDDILKEYRSFNATVGTIQLVGREIELWRPLIAIGRGTGLSDVEPLARDMAKDNRTRNSQMNPEYMLLEWLESEIAKGTYRAGYGYLANEIDVGVRAILDYKELTFWNGSQPGTILNRLLDYPSGFPRFKAGSGKGRVYYTDPEAIKRARERRPL
jgi:hypothetical protein